MTQPKFKAGDRIRCIAGDHRNRTILTFHRKP